MDQAADGPGAEMAWSPQAAASADPPRCARLVLRPWDVGDLDFLVELLGDPAVMRYFPAVLDRAGAKAQLDKLIERRRQAGLTPWLVEDRSGRPVGRVGPSLQEVAGEWLVECGWMIRSSEQRRGYALEAARAAVSWCFNTLGVDRVISLVRPENIPSAGVARRLGMSPGVTVSHAGLPHVVWTVRRGA